MFKFHGIKSTIGCAGVIIVCLVLAVIGWIAFKIIDKGSDDTPSVETEVTEEIYSFDSIKVTGHTDVEIVAGTVHTNMVSDVDLVGTEPEDGKVAVIGEEGKTGPSVKTDGSTLVIDGGDSSQYSSSFTPKVVIYCSEDTLRSIEIDSPACNAEMGGLSFEKADIKVEDGEIKGDDLISEGISIQNDSGDTDISGDLKGLTEISSNSGDIMVIVEGSLEKYAMDITNGKDGDIWVDARKIDDVSYSKDIEDEWDTDNRMLKLTSTTGEIVVKYK